jgi:hypothetical protein
VIDRQDHALGARSINLASAGPFKIICYGSRRGKAAASNRAAIPLGWDVLDPFYG